MRHYRHGAHTKTDLKAHIVWIPKYRKKVLIGPVAVRVRDLIRQIAMEHELHIISGKVARDHVHVFVSYRPHQEVDAYRTLPFQKTDRVRYAVLGRDAHTQVDVVRLRVAFYQFYSSLLTKIV